MNELFKRYQKWLARCGLLLTVAIASALPGTTLAALLDNTLDLPFISYDNQGLTTYDAGSGIFSVYASPLAILVSGNPPAIISDPESFIINITVDSTGALTGGIPGDDLMVAGQVDLGGIGILLWRPADWRGERLRFPGFRRQHGLLRFHLYGHRWSAELALSADHRYLAQQRAVGFHRRLYCGLRR